MHFVEAHLGGYRRSYDKALGSDDQVLIEDEIHVCCWLKLPGRHCVAKGSDHMVMYCSYVAM